MNKSKTAETVRTTLSIGGMSCGACVRHVTGALDGLTGVLHVDVDFHRNEAIVEHIPAQADTAALMAAVRDAGYSARVDRGIPSQAETRSGCGCGCSAPTEKTADWLNLGTSTIG